jgi:hypothetical protein
MYVSVTSPRPVSRERGGDRRVGMRQMRGGPANLVGNDVHVRESSRLPSAVMQQGSVPGGGGMNSAIRRGSASKDVDMQPGRSGSSRHVKPK